MSCSFFDKQKFTGAKAKLSTEILANFNDVSFPLKTSENGAGGREGWEKVCLLI